jgi:hypothetical protein
MRAGVRFCVFDEERALTEADAPPGLEAVQSGNDNLSEDDFSNEGDVVANEG